MNIVGYGGGTNSTAMLIGLYHRKIPVDLILFSNTGGEQPHTYDFLPIMDRWLEEHGLPTITQVEYTDRNGDRLTLEQECLRSGTLPAIAYGYKKCSLKHKIQPQDKFCNNYPPCREVWARGERVVKFIGFDIGEQKRRDHAQPIDDADTKYKKEYPLMDWSWTAAWTSTSTASGHRHGPAPAMRRPSRLWRTTGLRCRQRWSRSPPRRTEG